MLKTSLIACALALFPFFAAADDLRGLCQHDFEGTYFGTLGTSKVRVNLVCIDNDNLSATICPALDSEGHFSIDMVTNLSNAAVDGDRLVIANFALENSARAAGSSKSIVSYLTLSLSALLSGQLKGVYMSGAMSEFQPVAAKRIETYPVLTPAAGKPLSADDVGGVFRTDMPEDRDGMNFIFNTLLGAPVISIVGVYSHFVNHYTEGPVWNSSGVFSSVTAEGNGGEPDDKKLNYLRGRFLDQDHVEFYIISPTLGLRGPFHGTRIPGSLRPNP